MKKVLITGGAGFIGTHLSKVLVKTGYEVRIIDSISPQIHGAIPKDLDWLASNNIEFIRESITKKEAVENALEGVSYVIHLAAETGTGQSMYEITKYNYVNSQGTALLLNAIANSDNHTVERIILASSRSVYGEGAYVCKNCDSSKRIYPNSRTVEYLAKHYWEPLCPVCSNSLEPVPTNELDQVKPASIYAATKYAQEELIRVSCESLGIGYTSLRFQNVYGEGQSLQNPYTGILSIFSTRIRRKLELTIFEDGLESRDFVHVEDVVNSIQRCLLTKHPTNSVVNVGSGVATSVLEVAQKLANSMNTSPHIKITSDYRLGDIRHNFADITRLDDELDYKPVISLDEGLNRFCEWVCSQPLPEDLLDKANAELRTRKLMS